MSKLWTLNEMNSLVIPECNPDIYTQCANVCLLYYWKCCCNHKLITTINALKNEHIFDWYIYETMLIKMGDIHYRGADDRQPTVNWAMKYHSILLRDGIRTWRPTFCRPIYWFSYLSRGGYISVVLCLSVCQFDYLFASVIEQAVDN